MFTSIIMNIAKPIFNGLVDLSMAASLHLFQNNKAITINSKYDDDDENTLETKMLERVEKMADGYDIPFYKHNYYGIKKSTKLTSKNTYASEMNGLYTVVLLAYKKKHSLDGRNGSNIQFFKKENFERTILNILNIIPNMDHNDKITKLKSLKGAFVSD